MKLGGQNLPPIKQHSKFYKNLATVLNIPISMAVAAAVFILRLPRDARSRVFVVCGDHFLVIKNIGDIYTWTLPGGGIKKGEQPAVGAARELKEELGFQARPGGLTQLGYFTKDQVGRPFDKDCYVFDVADLNINIRLNLEIVEAKWVPLDNLPGGVSPIVRLAVGELLKNIG